MKLLIGIIIGTIIAMIVSFFMGRALADDGRFKELYRYRMDFGVANDVLLLEDTRYKVICWVYDGYNKGGISCISKKELGLK